MLPTAPRRVSGLLFPSGPTINGVAHVLQRVTMSRPDDLDWLPAEGTHLTHQALVELFISLRALIDGTDEIEPNRSHAISIAFVLRDAMRETRGE
jgi:hypothetical protein